MVSSPFRAKGSQVGTYLLGVALFSISFLVFLNASVSFVITDLIGQRKRVGDAVGSLGFTDELVALVACPFWGLLSDRLGVRWVCTIGYAIVGVSLFVFVQAKNVYPDLLLARMFFSIGGAATSTMVTAVLPAMTASQHSSSDEIHSNPTMEPVSHASSTTSGSATRSGTSQVAGLVGMFTGCGALVALGVFLPLPARFQHSGNTPAEAVQHSYYVVGSIALVVAIVCSFGLMNLAGEENKGWRSLFHTQASPTHTQHTQDKLPSYWRLFTSALKLGFTDIEIGLGYLGGFVARASSVGISLFIPLYINAYFISSGLCKDTPGSAPSDIKEQCKRAYTVAAMLTGVSQLIALLCAPIFGALDGRFRRYNAPLLVSSLAGVLGYILFARVKNPDPKNGGSGSIFGIVALLGISQIGAIVCSLSMLGRGIERPDSTEVAGRGEEERDLVADDDEDAPLIIPSGGSEPGQRSRRHLKGSIAGVYSLAGGAGILLLTKLGGTLFDKWSPGAPFYMLAIFNGILLFVVAVCGVLEQMNKLRQE